MCLQRTWTNWMKSMIESNIQCVILYIYIYIFYIHVFTHLEISSSYMVHTHKHTLIYDFKIRAWLQYRYPYHSSSSWLINFCSKHKVKKKYKKKGHQLCQLDCWCGTPSTCRSRRVFARNMETTTTHTFKIGWWMKIDEKSFCAFSSLIFLSFFSEITMVDTEGTFITFCMPLLLWFRVTGAEGYLVQVEYLWTSLFYG